MLGDVNRRAAIFSAGRNTLQDAQQDEERRAGGPGLRIGRNEADQEGRAAHQSHGDEEGALAAELVADDAEDQRSQGPEGKPRREQSERSDQGWSRIEPGEEDLGDDRREASEDEEVVPFEGRASGRGDNDARHRPGLLLVLFGYGRHRHSPETRVAEKFFFASGNKAAAQPVTASERLMKGALRCSTTWTMTGADS